MALMTWLVLNDLRLSPDSVKLGQIVPDPRHPILTLGDALPFENGDDVKVVDEDGEVIVQTEEVKEKQRSIAATFFKSLKLKSTSRKEARTRWEIDGISTMAFEPTERYVQKSMTHPAVSRYLASYQSKKTVYMVVGLKIGHNAKLSQVLSDSRSGSLEYGLAHAIKSLSAEATVSMDLQTDGSTTFHVSSDFVFAYRLRECRYIRPSPKFGILSRMLSLGGISGVPQLFPSGLNVAASAIQEMEELRNVALAEVDVDEDTFSLDDSMVFDSIDLGERARSILVGHLH